MKKLVGFFLVFGFLLALQAPAALAGDGYRYREMAGDEDPFPLMCADFSGGWKSDAGDRYSITQRQCNYLKLNMTFGSEQDVMTIIPDNKTRADRGSQVRTRWNSPDNATVLETHRTYMDGPNTRVTEVIMLERASGDLLLETTYVTVENLAAPNQPPHREYHQVVFRKVGAQPTQDQDGGDNGDVTMPVKKPAKAPKHHR